MNFFPRQSGISGIGTGDCVCGALLPALKKTRYPFLYTVLISGPGFGCVHKAGKTIDCQKALEER